MLYVLLQIFATIRKSVSNNWQHITGLSRTMVGGLRHKPNLMVNTKTTIYTSSGH